MGNNSRSDFCGLRTSQPAISKWFANIHYSLGTPTSPARLPGAVPRAAELTPGHSKGAVLAWHLLRVLGGEALRKKSRLHRGRSGWDPALG